MSNPTLPTRASLEYLRKLAKDRLAVLREKNPQAQLATALLAVAQEHGFSSWRALKAEIDRRHTTHASQLFEAIDHGDAGTVRSLLRDERARCTTPPRAATSRPSASSSTRARIRTMRATTPA
jgi:hypothetical protein